MPHLSQAKTLGGVGSILMLLAAVPAVGWVLSIAGAILVLIAIKYISEIVQDGSIFTNMILAVVLGIVGVVVGVVVILSAFFATLGLGAFTSAFPSGFSGGFPGYSTPSAIPTGDWAGLIVGALAGLAAIWVLLLVSAIFVRKSYGSISKKLGVGMFGTAGLLFLIGAALTIVLVGFVLLFVAVILNIVAFFSIPDQPPAQPMAQQSPPPATA